MKQTIEIEVPEGKKAVWENNRVKFVDTQPYWESITTFADAYWYCYNSERFAEYVAACLHALPDTYEEKVAKLRLVIAALTNNEKLSLVKGELYFPVVQFCSAFSINNCPGNKIIGEIKTERKEYTVVGGIASHSSIMGLGCVDSEGLSLAYENVSFIKVSSKEIAEHLSTYFGKLIFEVMYGGSNCDWEWVEKDKKY